MMFSMTDFSLFELKNGSADSIFVCNSNVNLQSRCRIGRIYDLKRLDSVFLLELGAYLSEEFVLIKKVKSNKRISLFEIGCVSDNIQSTCTHSFEVYVFFTIGKKVYFIKDNKNLAIADDLIQQFLLNKLLTSQEAKLYKDHIKLRYKINSRPRINSW